VENKPGQSARFWWFSFFSALNDGPAFGIATAIFFPGQVSVLLDRDSRCFLFGRAPADRSGGSWASSPESVAICGPAVQRRPRDFIGRYWPGSGTGTFRVADALLCIAVGLLCGDLVTDSSSNTCSKSHKNRDLITALNAMASDGANPPDVRPSCDGSSRRMYDCGGS
jgi:hypothetical protein